MIKRAESYRSWADIEDLANGFENLSQNLEQHKQTAANAFQEIFGHMERFKKEITVSQREGSLIIQGTKDEMSKFKDEIKDIDK